MHLSDLGHINGGGISREIRRDYESLRAFIEQEVADRLRVVRYSRNHTVLGVVPRVEAPEEIEGWDSLPARFASGSVPRWLHVALWTAFRKPLATAEERYVVVKDTDVRFVDVPAENRPPDSLHVARNLIKPDSTAAETYERAGEWAQANNLDVRRFNRTDARDSRSLPTDDLLGRLIQALDLADLQKVSMPMEVVAKLRRHGL